MIFVKVAMRDVYSIRILWQPNADDAAIYRAWRHPVIGMHSFVILRDIIRNIKRILQTVHRHMRI